MRTLIPSILRKFTLALCTCMTFVCLASSDDNFTVEGWIAALFQALARWWQRHSMVTGNEGRAIYMWWCLFVNNQFRLLEDGQVQEVNDFSHVFGRQLESTGRMLMCLDKLRGSQYITRIWCIFEVFIACQRPGWGEQLFPVTLTAFTM